jgi:hypothetical protein
VCVGVAALAVAAFIFSYTGIHAVALQAGVNIHLAKGYPLILDVLLVVILAATLALRGAGWPSKLLAWVSLLALLAAAAGADALHAAGDRLPARTAEITVAVLPWALVLIAFLLLLAMLRQARIRRQAQAGELARPPKWQPPQPPPLPRQALVPGFPAAAEPAAEPPTVPVPVVAAPAAEAPAVHAPAAKPTDTLRLVVPRQVTPETVAGSAATEPATADGEPDGALDAELAPGDPGNAEAAAEPAADHLEAGEDLTAMAVPDEAETEAGPDEADTAETAGAVQADAVEPEAVEPSSGDPDMGQADAGEPDSAGDLETADMEMPVFHRMWSSPEPPSEDAG